MAWQPLKLESTAEMGGEPPATDRLAMERARARVELALFGHAEPARIGRYEILEPIAGGGMGFVYAAYDPELDRKVALKVLHCRRASDPRSHERLMKEARALARLDHPNVVTVHDVLSHHGEIVIVMELVAGETLEDWQAAAPRSWRELVAAYLQAGEGLTAAHGLDVVHRDFKPSNAIMGNDGRVRVLDFGLARLTTEGGEPSGSAEAGAGAAVSRSVSGTVLGTPEYSAPEQLAGDEVTLASDQFSFCAALHRAVEGVAPFRGATIQDLLASILTSAPRGATDGRHVPRWLRRALRRGLAAEPARRHPSMRALLSELGRTRGWRRWRWPGAAALLAAASVVVTAAVHRDGDAAPACDGGAPEVAAVWGRLQRIALGAKLAHLGAPYAREVEARVLAGLDAASARWQSVHRTACLDHRRGVDSDAMLDRKMLCLRRRLADLAAAVGVLRETGIEGLPGAVDVVAGIPPPAMCADPVRLLSEVDTLLPVQRSRVERVRSLVSRAAALRRAGRAADSVEAIRVACSEAAATGHQPVIAEALLEHGRILMAQLDIKAATPVLLEAMEAALASNEPRLAVEAAARRIYTEGVQSVDLERLGRDLAYVDPMSRSLTGDRFARPLLLNNVGVVYMAAKRRDEALRNFQLARDAMAGDPQPDLELTSIDHNIAMLTSDAADRARRARDVWLRREAVLGKHHLATLRALVSYAAFQSDPAKAHELMAQACAGYKSLHPQLVGLYADCESESALLANELGERDQAYRAYSAVMDVTALSSDPDLVVLRDLAAGELALLRRAHAEAIAHFDAVLETRGDSTQWWEQKHAFHAQLGLGLAHWAAGDRAEASRRLEAAARGFGELVLLNPDISFQLRLAKTQRSLALIQHGGPEREATSRH